MKVQSIVLSELSHSEKANTIWLHSYVELNKTNEKRKKKDLLTIKNQVVVAGGEVGGGETGLMHLSELEIHRDIAETE